MPNTQTLIIIAILLISGGLYWYLNNQRKSGTGGKTVLQAYTKDLTASAKAGHLDVVIGRNEEIDRVIHILSRRTKNNPLLLGEPGVGKTAIVEGIAKRIIAGEVPDTIKNKRLLSLDLGALIGGTKYRGEFEERLKRLTQEIEGLSANIILFVDEVQMIEQAKGGEGALNISDIIKPPLSRGELHMIGATTWHEYEQFIKLDDALNRRLQPVIVGEPKEDDALAILRGTKGAYEEFHKVRYSDEAISAAVSLSKKYIKDRFLPDKAIDLIDEAGAKVSIEGSQLSRGALGVLHSAGAAAKKKSPPEAEPVVTKDDIAEIVADWVGKDIKEIV